MGRMRDTYGTYERHIWDHMGDSPCGRFLYTCCTIIAQRERERERNRPLRERERARARRGREREREVYIMLT